MPKTSGYASVNGLSMYYEIHGKGQPLLVLHGATGSTEFVEATVNYFMEEHTS